MSTSPLTLVTNMESFPPSTLQLFDTVKMFPMFQFKKKETIGVGIVLNILILVIESTISYTVS